MSQPVHTYGPTCHLAKSVTFSGSKTDEDMPGLKAHFFYASLPIDDPLSAAPALTGSDSKSANHPPRPFSAFDNNALEEAWLGLGSERDRKIHNKGKLPKVSRPSQNDRPGSTVGALGLAAKQKRPSTEVGGKPRPEARAPTSPSSNQPPFKAANSTNVMSPLSADSIHDEPSPHASKKPAKAKDANRTPGTSDNEAKAVHDELSKKLVADREERRKTEAKGNPYNPKCDDPHHVPLDSSVPVCCSELENPSEVKPKPQHAPAEASHENTTGSGEQGVTAEDKKPKLKGKHATMTSPSREVGAGQGDATDESFLTKVACSLKECDSSKPPIDCAEDPAQCGLSSREHAALEKHENSKAHQGFEKHRQVKHPDVQPSESADKKTKSLEKKAATPLQVKKPEFQPESMEKKPKPSEKNSTPPVQTKQRDSHAPEPKGQKPKPSEKTSTPQHLQVEKVEVNESELSLKKKKWPDKNASHSNQPLDLTNRADQGNDAGTTGRPFLKLPSRPMSPQPPAAGKSNEVENTDCPDSQCGGPGSDRRKRSERDSTETETLPDHKCKAHKNNKEHTDVPVGVSRLHKVILPALQMEPIYWSPVHDVVPVTRGTWFYKDTMCPVEPPVANQLETGYRELRPWSQTWKDELHSAIEVGAAGEEKVAHNLWPRDEDKRIASDDIFSTDSYCAARCFQGEAAAEGTADLDDSDKKSPDTNTIAKKYPNAQVIYNDAKNAYILKPNLHPSAYHKRRPLHKIKKGLTVGIHVVRGFDWKAWERLHPSKRTIVTKKVDEQAAVSGDSDLGKRHTCLACKSQEERKECTDLVLVIHGIGQKLSQRVESFNFTHAINAFRRSVNVELSIEAVRKVLRDDLGGFMVLPVNWRSNLSFDDGDPMKDGENDGSGSDFSLNDITPSTIPAVRSLISDVMLDIPYYMSHNKTRMIQAVISEANRVYRLWCKNNPEFHKNGRVHVIAHSLGSAMAMEILSKQPTLVPKVDFNGRKINTKHFDFNTTNLICAGSPAGFFLLLEKGKLIPRKGQSKPGAEVGDDKDKTIVSDAGMFGCLAVDNIYNVMHQNDPIAYRLNACADPYYAASLKTAYVPSATTGFFESISNAMKSMAPGVAAPADLTVGQMTKPATVARLPSQLEMEVHNFTAEERAEKKFYLLNDNGQVDYFLASGGGPLEIQYLNMLSAHSSYWTHPDFIRMLVTEVGRKAGRNNCLPNMKAIKIRNKP